VRRERYASGWRPFAARQAGVTMIELLIVLALVSLIVGIMFPSISSGVDSLRLQQAADGIAGFINSGLNRAERKQVVVELTVDRAANELWLRSTETGFVQTLEMPEGVRIINVLPQIPDETATSRHFDMYPGGAPTRAGVVIENRKGARRIVRVDPVTGVPQVERPEQGNK